MTIVIFSKQIKMDLMKIYNKNNHLITILSKTKLKNNSNPQKKKEKGQKNTV